MFVKIKPKILTATNKSDLVSKINRLAGHYGYRYPLTTDTDVVLYNLQKTRKKTKINKRKKKLVTEHGTSYQRDIVKQKEWKAYVYFIPKNLVKSYRQESRNFTVEFK